MANANILVVEDEPVIALDIKQRLLHLGYRVTAIADSAETALEAIHHALPDLALMDIRLRGEMNGIETATQIRQQFNLPIVFLTAHADATTLEQVKATQPFGYITKPFDTHDLSTAIEIALTRHQAEITIQTALDKERELHQLKSRFISIVSHEFRNPLNSILFSLNLLEHHEQQLTPEKKQLYFQRAKVSVQRMSQLLEEVLVVGEAETGKLRCHPVPLNLNKFCRELIEELQTSVTTKHTIILKQEGWESAGDDLIYSLDEKLLRHILNNLLSNAIKYSPQGDKIVIHLLCQPTNVTFHIQDQGIGIPAEDQAQLFDCFYRATNVNNIPGTGLGLSIVKQCIDTHKGKITVESQVGKGTTFIVTLDNLN